MGHWDIGTGHRLWGRPGEAEKGWPPHDPYPHGVYPGPATPNGGRELIPMDKSSPNGASIAPNPAQPGTMKAVTAAVLLVLVLALGPVGAARSRREAPAEDAPEVPAEDFFSRHLQSFSDFMTKDLPQRLQVEEMRSQAEAYLDRANKQLTPLAQELRSNVLGLFSSLLDLGKSKEQR
ncbi:apolipoprotein A-II [Melopsittacus undulatus]|uniref:apolipoprotein A-II n=1 Tax=Melopsittacus undulatus TaxID=13146 RepID=UPI00146DBFBB|nr:apolipoprotein A-II-like [Melopsittacus undulatus]